MDRLKEKFISIFIVVINFMFFLKLLKESFKIEDFDYILVMLLMIFGILIYLLYTFILDKRRYKIICSFIILGVMAILFYKYREIISIYFSKEFLNNILKINNELLNEKTTYFYEYKEMFFVLIPLLLCVLIALTGFWKNVSIFFNFVVMISFWYQIFYKTVLHNIYYFLTVSLLTFSITSFIKKIDELKSKEIKININIKQVMLYSIVISLIITRIISILPQHYNGENMAKIVDFFENRFAPTQGVGDLKGAFLGEFNLRQSGYSDTESKLGGAITIDKKEVFRVSSDKPYYLKGVVKDYYSGSYWLNSDELAVAKTKEYDFENAGLKSIGEGEATGLISATTRELEIFPSKNLNSTSFFTPNNSIDVISDYKGVFYTKVPTFMSDLEIREPYKVTYFSYTNYENYVEGIQNRPNIDGIKEENYNFPIRYVGEPFLNYKKRIDELQLSTNEKSERSNILENYEKYFQLDSKIPGEVYDILDLILSNTGKEKNKLTNYEKALAIRNYLTKNYSYSLQVSDPPEDKDFVYHFLFEEKQGYCTYFATATTILCRMAGIPARYAEGFKTPDNKDGNGRYIVTNAEAHAWSEILINPEKDLWIVVDPATTPTEFEALNSPNSDNEDNANTDNTQGGNSNGKKPQRENPMEEGIDDEYEGLSISTNRLFVTVAIPSAIFLYVIYRVLLVKRRRKNIFSSTSIIPLYEYYLDRLETISIEKPEDFGDLEFVEGIREPELKEKLKELTILAYEEFYGGLVRKHIEIYEYMIFIEDYLKSKEKKVSYYMKKYFGI